jgi:hypothetical protein
MGRGSVQTDQGHHRHRRLHCDGEQCNTNLKTRVCVVSHEYACLMVRGYKTAETKKAAFRGEPLNERADSHAENARQLSDRQNVDNGQLALPK